MRGPRVCVLIVDDDYYAREAMQILVSKDSRTSVWGTASGGDDAVEQLTKRKDGKPEIILLDVRLGASEHGGVDAIHSLKDASPSSRILMTSVDRTEETIIAAIRQGADGYVWKNESTDGIAGAIVRVAQGRFVVTRSVAEQILGKTIELRNHVTEIYPDTPAYQDLTEALRKTVYLYCLCGMSAREIAEELHVSVNTVNSRVKVAYQILNASSRAEAFQRLVERE